MRKEIIQILSKEEAEQRTQANAAIISQRLLQDEQTLASTRAGAFMAGNLASIPGSLNQQRDILSDRLERNLMGREEMENESYGHQKQRRQPLKRDPHCRIQLNKLLIYGTEFWTTTKLKGIEVAIEKLDESHKIILFNSFTELMKWLGEYDAEKRLAIKMEEEDDEGSDLSTSDKLKGWFALQSYREYGHEFERSARFLLQTETDSEMGKQEVESLQQGEKMRDIMHRISNQTRQPRFPNEEILERRRPWSDRRRGSRGSSVERSKSRQPSRSRDKGYYRAHRHHQSQTSNSRNRDYSVDARRRMYEGYAAQSRSIQPAPDPRRRPDRPQLNPQSNILEGINLQLNSQSTPMELEHDLINRITDAMQQMDLEEGEVRDDASNMSIQIARQMPRKQEDDMDVALIEEPNKPEQGSRKNPPQVPRKDAQKPRHGRRTEPRVGDAKADSSSSQKGRPTKRKPPGRMSIEQKKEEEEMGTDRGPEKDGSQRFKYGTYVARKERKEQKRKERRRRDSEEDQK